MSGIHRQKVRKEKFSKPLKNTIIQFEARSGSFANLVDEFLALLSQLDAKIKTPSRSKLENLKGSINVKIEINPSHAEQLVTWLRSKSIIPKVSRF